MEQFIGDIGGEIRLHSNPYSNLSQCNVHHAQVNALKAMFPELENEKGPPRASHSIGNGYRLLAAHNGIQHRLHDCELVAFVKLLEQEGERVPARWTTKVERWAQLQLPNGQIARSAWKEGRKALENLQISCMVKVSYSVQTNQPCTH